jgi:hypothetical protein
MGLDPVIRSGPSLRQMANRVATGDEWVAAKRIERNSLAGYEFRCALPGDQSACCSQNAAMTGSPAAQP